MEAIYIYNFHVFLISVRTPAWRLPCRNHEGGVLANTKDEYSLYHLW